MSLVGLIAGSHQGENIHWTYFVQKIYTLKIYIAMHKLWSIVEKNEVVLAVEEGKKERKKKILTNS